MGRTLRVLIQMNHILCPAKCLEKMKKLAAKKFLIFCALLETEDHITSFQVDVPSPYHLKTSGFDIFKWLEREHYWPEMGYP